MGAVGDILSGGASIANLIYQIQKDQSLTGAQIQQNAFNSAEAAAQRVWSSTEADEARQWQEEQYVKYNSPQAMIRQYQDAGLNPALMYSGAAGTSGASTQTSVPSGSAASNSLSQHGDVSGALLAFAQLSKLRSEIDLNEANAKNLNTQSWATEQLTPIQVEEASSRIAKNNQDISESEARCGVLVGQSILQSKEIEWFNITREIENQERLMNIAVGRSRKDEIEQHILNLKQEALESVSRTAVNWANKGLIDQETINALAELDLIKANTANAEKANEGIEYSSKMQHFIYDKRETDRIFRLISEGTGAVGNLAGAYGSIGRGFSGFMTPKIYR